MKFHLKNTALPLLVSFVVLIALWSTNCHIVTAKTISYSNNIEVVQPSKNWTIHFNKPIDPTYMSKNFIYVEDENKTKLDCSLELLDNGKSVVLKAPKEGYSSHKSYSLIVHNIKSTDNKTLKKDYIKQFKIESTDNVIGNTSGNLISNGFVSNQGDWVYYINHSDNNSIYKMNKDGKNKTKLNSNNSSYINVIGEWIYYIDYANEFTPTGIYKLKTDGSENIKIRDINDEKKDLYTLVKNSDSDDEFKERVINNQPPNIRSLVVVKDKIYYISAIDRHVPCYIRVLNFDGSVENSIKLDYPPNEMIVHDKYIYYWNYSYSGNKSPISRINIDGSNHMILDKDDDSRFLSSVDLYGEQVYFAQAFDDKNLYKVNLDGSNKTLVTSKFTSCSNININNNWIYYIQDSSIYRLNTNGDKKQNLYTIPSNCSATINILDDYVYILEKNSNDCTKMYRLNANTLQKEEIY